MQTNSLAADAAFNAAKTAASAKSPLAQIDKVLPGQTVELLVQAANQSAQSLPSAVVVVTLPALAVAAGPVRGAAKVAS